MTTSALDQARTDEENERHSTPAEGIGAGRPFAWLLVICGALGLLASWVITIDKFKLLQAKIDGTTFTPGCSLNPIVNCGNIMESKQAAAFGFPNPMIGLVAYSVVIAVGVGAVARARHRRWFWLGLQAGTVFGVGFITWLQYQSLYNIQSLCLWCCLVHRRAQHEARRHQGAVRGAFGGAGVPLGGPGAVVRDHPAADHDEVVVVVEHPPVLRRLPRTVPRTVPRSSAPSAAGVFGGVA
jgi:uncharacterized membrane protein